MAKIIYFLILCLFLISASFGYWSLGIKKTLSCGIPSCGPIETQKII